MIGTSSILEKIQTGLKELESCRDELESSDEIQCALTVAESIYSVDSPDYLKSAIARWTWGLHQRNTEVYEYWGRTNYPAHCSVRVALTAYLPFDPASMQESLNWALKVLDSVPTLDDPRYNQWLAVNENHVRPLDLVEVHGDAGDYLQTIAHSVIVAADDLAVGVTALRSCIDAISAFPCVNRAHDPFTEGMSALMMGHSQSASMDYTMTDGSVLSHHQQDGNWYQTN